MVHPEDAEEIVVADKFRIVLDLEGLGVVPHPAVGGRCRASPRVPHTRPHDSGDTPEPGVGAPESAEGERRRLGRSGKVRIHGRNAAPAWHQTALHFQRLRRRPCSRRRNGKSVQPDRKYPFDSSHTLVFDAGKTGLIRNFALDRAASREEDVPRAFENIT